MSIRAVVRAFIVVGAVAASACGDDPPTERDVPFEGDAWVEPASPFVPPAAGAALVTDSLSDTLSVLDLGTGAVLATRPVGRNPVDIDGPHHVTVDAANGVAYIALSYPIPGGAGPHAGHGSSQALGWVQRISLDDLRVDGEVRVATNPGDVVVSRDGARVVVSHFDLAALVAAGADAESARAQLAILDAAPWRAGEPPQPRFVDVCAAPHGMELSPDGRHAFVACYGEDAVAVVDLDAETVELVPAGPGGGIGIVAYGPYALSLSPDGAMLAVANLESRDVRFFTVDGGTLSAITPGVGLPGAAYFPAWSDDGRTLWVPYQSPDGLARIDVDTGMSETIPIPESSGCLGPHEVELAPDGRLLVVCEGDHVGPGAVAWFDPDTSEVVASTPVGVFPDAIAIVGGPTP